MSFDRNECFMAGFTRAFSVSMEKEAGAMEIIKAKVKGAVGKAKDVAARHPKKTAFAGGLTLGALLNKLFSRSED